MTPLLSSALLATQSDARLLALAADGHDRAFEAIVERYRRPLGRYLRRVLSAPLAEDVLQATFVNAWRSLERGTDVRDLRPWLYRIAHNQAVNALSRAEPRVTADAAAADLAAPGPSPEAEAEQRDTLQRTLTAIAGLPDRQRAAIVAVAVEDRPHPDVAQELGLTEGALRQLIHRARTTLRAAATAVVPLPLVSAAVGAGGDTPLARVAEVAAGAGGAGLGVKTGAALLAAGAMVVGAPAVHDQRAHPGAPRAAVAHAGAAPMRAARSPHTPPAPAPARTARPRPAVHPAIPRVHHRTTGAASGEDRRGGTDGEQHSTPGRRSGEDDGGGRTSASSPERHDDGGRTESVASGGDHGDHSGSGDDAVAATTQAPESGSGSGSSDGGSSTTGAVAPVATATGETSDGSGHGSDDGPLLP